MAQDETLYKAVVDMAQLLRDLYHNYQVGLYLLCLVVTAAFGEHCAPGSASHYLFFLEEDVDRLLEDIWHFGMAMLFNYVVESPNGFLKLASL